MSSQAGTPYYMAPEVISSNYTKLCDLWAVGVITYFILAGYPPFNASSQNKLFRRILRGEFEFWDQHWKHISRDAKDFITKLLVKDPNKRMTAEEALNHQWIISAGA